MSEIKNLSTAAGGVADETEFLILTSDGDAFSFECSVIKKVLNLE